MEDDGKWIHLIFCAEGSVNPETKKHVESLIGPVAWLDYNPMKAGGQFPRIERVLVDVPAAEQEG